MKVKADPPVFATVRVLAALVVPSVTFPKDSDVGVTATIAGFAGAWYSTAPMSIELFRTSGRGFPKKSVVGALVYAGLTALPNPVQFGLSVPLVQCGI